LGYPLIRLCEQNIVRGEQMKDVYELFDSAQRLFMKGKYRESIEKFTKTLQAGHEPGIVCLSRGVAYLKINESDEAIKDFDKTIGIDGGNATAFHYRGTAYMLKEDYARAVADFSKAIEIHPGHRAAILARGVSYVNMGRTEEGSSDIRRAMVSAAAAMQGFSDVSGWRTQLDKVIAAMEGHGKDEVDLTEKEIETLKAWLKAA
jgi:tetratricopeptide (TPR) repeat protein